MNDDETNEGTHSSLFPSHTTEHPPIELIYVERITPQGVLSASRPLTAAELRTPGDLAARFGRGSYRLTARGPRGKLAAKTTEPIKVDYGGEPRSMQVDAEDEPPPAPRAPQANGPAPPAEQSILMAFMQMMREDARAAEERAERRERAQAERDQRSHELALQSQNANVQLLVAALTKPPPPADTTAAQVLAQVLGQVIPANSRGPSPGIKDLKELMELAKAATPEAKKDDLDFQNMIAQALGAYVATKEAQNGAPQQGAPAGLPPAPPSQPPQEPEKQPTVTNFGASQTH